MWKLWKCVCAKYMGKYSNIWGNVRWQICIVKGKYIWQIGRQGRCVSITTGGCYQRLQIYGPALAIAHPSNDLLPALTLFLGVCPKCPKLFTSVPQALDMLFLQVGHGLAECRPRKRVNAKALIPVGS